MSFGAKLKSMASTASKSVSQYVSAPQDAESGKSGTMNKFYNVKRRVTESMMTSMGKAEVTEDIEYDSRKALVLSHEKQFQLLRKQFVAYLESVRGMTFASSEIGTIIREAYVGAAPPGSSAVESYAAGMNSLDAGIRTTLDQEFLNDVLEPMDRQLAAYVALKDRMRERELIKLDFDARLRKLKLLKEQGSSDPAQLPKKEEKLRRNAEALLASSTEIFRDMDAIDAQRVAILSRALQRFASTQRAFFSGGLHTATSLPDIPATLTLRPPELPEARGMTAWQQVLSQGTPGISMPVSTVARTLPPAPVFAPTAPPGTATTVITTKQVSSTSEVLGAGSGRGAPGAPVMGMEVAKVTFPYKGTQPDELSLEAGESVTVMEKHADGWLKVRTSSGKTGFFPANYISTTL